MNFAGKICAKICVCACAAVVAIFCAAGCGERVPAAERAAESGILAINNGGEPSALDPQFAQPGVIENRIMLALFEGLVRYDPQTLAPVPAIAESWTISDDGTRYEFKLCDNAKFSDGSPITSRDFMFSFRRILSPKLASPCASLFFAPVKNARRFAAGEIDDFSEVGFSAPDDHTLVVKLENPCPYFLSLACHSSWSVVPASAILKFGAIDERSTLWTRPKNFVGSGPFRLKSWRVAYRIEVEKNPFYRDAANVALAGIRFDAIVDQFAEETAFNDGQYHITNTVPPARVAVLRQRHAPQLRLDPYFSTAFIRVNCAKPPLDDARVRRALSLALDRKALSENVLRAGETPAFRLVPEIAVATDAGNSGDDMRANVAEARRLLAEAGFPDGKNFPEISYLYNTSDGAQFFAQAIQEMWRKNLGIKVVLRNQEYKVYRVSLAQGDYELARSAWSGDFLDPTTFLELFASDGNMNWTNWKSPRYDDLLARAARERDPQARNKLLAEAEDALLADAPIIPTVHPRNKYLIRPEVQGWYPNLLDIHPYNSVHFAQSQK
ncbi:MAG: peptide ABC transporter substrate-binding protein [Opitutae bacterium]|nr:peptide ABC transporter substrate-binding protein [Opitutae bacterium]